ncbi:hypothetical protein Tcan_06629 [Toxocara canis]|uniref:Uncharacterized protein n=1 Tax=Toxocara canis TaxID=6265 RepID=A0A0B2UXF5_TOXCA|nr:hypothetical protein Tcan_06629 [Toxocara canis]
MLNAAFAFAEKELAKQHIAVDETLRTYEGRRVKVSNAIMLLLKAQFGLKPSFTIYRRLCAIKNADEYNGERMDRQNFKHTLRALKLKVEKMEQNQHACGEEERVEFFGREFVFNLKYLKLARPNYDADAKSEISAGGEKEAERIRSSQRKRSAKRVATPSPELSPASLKSRPQRTRRSIKMTSFTNVESLSGSEDADGSPPAVARVEPPSGDQNVDGSPKKPASDLKNNRFQTHTCTATPAILTQSKTESLIVKGTKGAMPRGRPRKRIKEEEMPQQVDDPQPPNNKRSVSRKVSPQQIGEANKAVVQKMFQLLTPQVKRAVASLAENSSGKSSMNEMRNNAPMKQAIIRGSESGRERRMQSLLKERQQDAAARRELEKRVNELQKVVNGLEQAKKDCEAELDLVKAQLDTAQTEIRRLNSINAELSKQEVAIKRNGEYTEELKACICHLKRAGVPDAKCGEVIISVGVLLGRKVVE